MMRKRTDYQKQYYQEHREAFRARAKVQYDKRRKTPEGRAEWSKYVRDLKLNRWLKSRGWTVAQYRVAIKRGCAICGRKRVRLCRDHNHDTGKARDLLCYRCNSCLGWYETNAEQVTQYRA